MKTRIQGRQRRVTVCCDHLVRNDKLRFYDYVPFVPIPQLVHNDGRMEYYTVKEIRDYRKKRDDLKRIIRRVRRQDQRSRYGHSFVFGV